MPEVQEKPKDELKIIPGSTSGDEGPSKEAIAGAAVYDGKVLPTEATPKATRAGGGALDEKGQLQLKAAQLNIVVDDEWDVSRLRGEIQMAREGRADLQVKGAVPPGEMSDVDSDPATKLDKIPRASSGVIPAQKAGVPIAGVTIAGEPAVSVAGPSGGAVPEGHVKSDAATPKKK